MKKAKNQKPLIETKNLEIGYRSKKDVTSIANRINIQLFPSELVAVIGINGVGKSTFLRTISGIQPPLSGCINIQQQDLVSFANQQRSEAISLVLTKQPISKNLSVFELVALGRQPYTNWLGNLSKNDLYIIENALRQTALLKLKDRKCYSLSDGQLQKALIARSMAQNTPIIILDEPTTHLDLYHKAYVIKLLKNLAKNTQKSIIFASHEINLALEVCDKIILMGPKNVNIDTPQNLIEKGAFQDFFPDDLVYFDATSAQFKIKK